VNLEKLARQFEKEYQDDWEADIALQRRDFCQKFPLGLVGKMTLEQYAIGQNRGESFCYWVETGTRRIAKIVGSPASKFGVYYGKTKSDSKQRYRYTKKYSKDLPPQDAQRLVFRRIRKHLVSLIDAGQRLDFTAIDQNPLSQMFKAKILCLYFPKNYLSICSGELLKKLSSDLGLNAESPSEAQHVALIKKADFPWAVGWSQPKFMDFLYDKVLKQASPASSFISEAEKKHRSPKETDFDKLMELWKRIGAESEQIAFSYEKKRLKRAGFGALIAHIQDRTKHPGFGFDFESFSDEETPRFIEVKTATKVSARDHRFFVSRNEKCVSESQEHKDEYYFYLVMHSASGKTKKVHVVKAADLYARASLQAETFQVRVSVELVKGGLNLLEAIE